MMCCPIGIQKALTQEARQCRSSLYKRFSSQCYFHRMQAEARQAKFDSSPGGRAANKAIANVAKEREADAAAASRKNNNAQDWLS